MYATQIYSAQDRVATSQTWAHKYPDRVPTIISSPHWAFYAFKCMLIPHDMSVSEFCGTVHRTWARKFASNVTQILLKVAPGSCSHPDTESRPLAFIRTFDDLARNYLASDGFLYLTVHTLV
jgi:hypothetical protein